ncbi:MAG: sulfatase-like hydrolase/transferase, partial [Acidobacteria bacterium]|nr:sulfatase-like hydrolase/transferase [Acidobacteriota bacterium]
GWTWLGSTPFQWWKMMPSHFGGTRVPLVLSWPARIKHSGGVRGQFAHVNDVAPTIYEVTGIRFPSIVDGVKQQPLDGVSFARTFDRVDEPSRRRTQYFEMLGNRAIYQGGWVAAARHRVVGLQSSANSDFTQDRWELYHVEKDFSEAHDVAGQYPDKLKRLQKLFDSEARKNGVYPLGGATPLLGSSGGASSLTANRRKFDYYPGMPRLQFRARPPLPGKSFRITAHAVLPESGAEGIIVSYGGRESGFALYAKDNRLIYENHRAHGVYEFIKSDTPLPTGDVVLAFEFTQERVSDGIGWFSITSSGTGRLSMNGKVVGQSKLTQTLGAGYDETFGVGQAFGPPVSTVFRPPFKFTGALGKVTVELE